MDETTKESSETKEPIEKAESTEAAKKPNAEFTINISREMVYGAILLVAAVVVSVGISSLMIDGAIKASGQEKIASFDSKISSLYATLEEFQGDLNKDLNNLGNDINAHKRTRALAAHALSCKTMNVAGTKFSSDYNATPDKNGLVPIKCTTICSKGAKLKCLVGERKTGGTVYIVPCEEEQKYKKSDLNVSSMRCICCS